MDKPTTRQQILEASDEQLNEWAATVVMGWRKAIGKYCGGEHWESNLGAMILVDKYIPVSDLAQAIMRLVETMNKEDIEFRMNFYCDGDLVVTIRRRYRKGPEDDRWLGEVGGLNRPRAITQACIMAKLGL